jgi:hypothetical protein
MMHILNPKGNIPSFFFKYGESADEAQTALFKDPVRTAL